MAADVPAAWPGPLTGRWSPRDHATAITRPTPAVHWCLVGPDHPGRHDAPGGWLAPHESEALARLRSDRRRTDWLRGRHAAKRLVVRLLQAEIGRACSWADLDVARTAAGAPALFLRDSTGGWAPLPMLVSISHSHDHAVAAAIWPRPEDDARAVSGLGVDLEWIESRDPAFVSDFLTGEERNLCARFTGVEREARVTAVWSGKEATLKALGLGLRVDTREVTCLPLTTGVDAADGWRPLALATGLAPAGHLRGAWRVEGSFALTIVALAAASPPPA
jgi:4'-phosphopantetheinyl transferase